MEECHSMEEQQSMEKECFKEESSSIRTQRILLRSFAEERFRGSKILEFKDDGYSGVTLERPGVSAMLELVKESAIDCIIVKDFPGSPGTILNLEPIWSRYSRLWGSGSSL